MYCGEGSLSRIRDLAAWAGGVAAALRPGGTLVVHDDHPASACLDRFLRWRDDYFAAPTVGALVGAVVEAGLAVSATGRDALALTLAAGRPARPRRAPARRPEAVLAHLGRRPGTARRITSPAIMPASFGFSWNRRSEYSYQRLPKGT